MERSFATKPHVSFEVERVIGVSSDGSYQVQWAPAWVSKFHLVGCEHLIQEFLQQKCQEEMGESNTQPATKSSHHREREEESQESMMKRTDNSFIQVSHESVANSGPFEPDLLENTNISTDFLPLIQEKSDTRGVEREEPVARKNQHFEELQSDFADTAIANMKIETTNIVIKIEDEEEINEEVPDTPSSASTALHTTDVSGEYNMATIVRRDPSKSTDKSQETTHGSSNFYEEQAASPYTNNSGRTLEPHHIPEHYNSSQRTEAFTRGEERRFHCEICGKSFGHNASLKNHIRLHIGDKPYSCSQCGYSCIQKGDLNKHLRTHTGVKPYTCSVCFKSFSESGNMRRHLRTHDKTSSSAS